MKINLKNPAWITGGMGFMLLCALFSSCSNEDFLGEKDSAKECDHICFGLSSANVATTKTLSDAQQEAYTDSRFVLRSDDSADSLCLRAVVTDGIYTSQQQKQQVVTRGLPVTELNSFHVQAHWTKQSDQTVTDKLFMNEEATKNGTIWSTQTIYYWPGSDFTLDFYAWAPSTAEGLTTTEATTTKNLTYTVPTDITKQSDLVVAKSTSVAGNNNAAVSLNFNHICTQVRFVIGNMMQPGTIVSVGFKGVSNKGTYNLSTAAWTLDNTSTGDFTYGANMTTTGSEADGTAITSGANTFMMLPQAFAEASTATVEVVFTDEFSKTRTLTANVAGSSWPMGKTVTYRLSITPEYDLKFETRDPIVDAHYVMMPIEINAGADIPAGGWTVEVENPDNATWKNGVTLKKLSDLLDLEKEGYWFDNTDTDYPTRQQKEAFTTTGKETVYVFLEENLLAADDNRSVTLKLYPTSRPTSVADRITIKQHSAYSAGDIYVERIEEDAPVPWGFAWDNVTEQFRTTQGNGNKVPPGQIDNITAALKNAGFNNLPDYIYLVTRSDNKGILLSIDYSKITTDINFSDTDGHYNTMALYNFDGISYISALKNFIASLGNVIHTNSSGDVIVNNPLEFAALSALKKNKFNLKTADGGDGAMMYIPELMDAEANWYLPAKDQFTDFAGITDAQLENMYWSSTGIDTNNENKTAYAWQNAAIEKPRMEEYKVRAVRRTGSN